MRLGRVVWSFAALATCIQSIPANAFAECPAYPVGITVKTRGTDRLFYATDRAEALADSDESRSLAAAEARVSARARLLKNKDVPKSSGGRLRGAVEVFRCSIDEFVYETLLVDEANARRAIALEDSISASIKSIPTPMAPEPPDGKGGMTSIFEKLIPPAQSGKP